MSTPNDPLNFYRRLVDYLGDDEALWRRILELGAALASHRATDGVRDGQAFIDSHIRFGMETMA